jgi:hypothetical protein
MKELSTYVSQRVSDLSNGQQLPSTNSGSYDDFALLQVTDSK